MWPLLELFAETPLLLLRPGSCCSLSCKPSDKEVYLIHILINMKPHFLLQRAPGEDIIHQALSPNRKLPILPRSQPMLLPLPLPSLFPHTLPFLLSPGLAFISSHLTENMCKWKIDIQKEGQVGVYVYMLRGNKQTNRKARDMNRERRLRFRTVQIASRWKSFRLCGKLQTGSPLFLEQTMSSTCFFLFISLACPHRHSIMQQEHGRDPTQLL